MPTYVCSVSASSLDAAQKRSIAQAISSAHRDATGAPAYLVQVIFQESEARDRYLGGQVAEWHIWIRGDIRAGRTEGQCQKLMRQIAKEVSSIAGIGEDFIWVYLCNLEAAHMIEYGRVLPAPGEEQAWFDGLPKALQDKLASLGKKD